MIALALRFDGAELLFIPLLAAISFATGYRSRR